MTTRQRLHIRRSWIEVANRADGAAPAVLVRRRVEALRAIFAAGEIEEDQARVHILLDLLIHDLDAELEVRDRMPDRAGADAPYGELEVASWQCRSAVRCHEATARSGPDRRSRAATHDLVALRAGIPERVVAEHRGL